MIGILDTNADPDEIQYPIPGNDDAIRSVSLLTRIIADAAAEGLIQRHQLVDAETTETNEPLAEWERELLEQGAPEQSSAQTEKVADESEAKAEAAEVEEQVAEGETPVAPAE